MLDQGVKHLLGSSDFPPTPGTLSSGLIRVQGGHNLPCGVSSGTVCSHEYSNRPEYFGLFFFFFKRKFELAKYSDSVSFHRAVKAYHFNKDLDWRQSDIQSQARWDFCSR